MEWLRRIFSKPAPRELAAEELMEKFRPFFDDGRDGIDHLGKAAVLGDESQRAVKEGRYDEAWGLIHDQKHHYLLHAKNYGMTARQTLALDGSLHVALANIRRLEGNHDDALVHVLYAEATSDRRTKSGGQKLRAYFNRCKFRTTTLDDAVAFLEQRRAQPSIRANQIKIAEWRERG